MCVHVTLDAIIIKIQVTDDNSIGSRIKSDTNLSFSHLNYPITKDTSVLSEPCCFYDIVERWRAFLNECFVSSLRVS